MKATVITHSNDEDFDISRMGTEPPFTYTRNGKKVENQQLIREIESLVIPPNWKDVSICSDNCKHIRAYGFDDKGRKQYIYHEQWLEQRRKAKFSKMAEFAEALPKIRKEAHKDLSQEKWVKEKVLALVVLTLDETYARIGNESYKRKNETYGLTTLRRKHLSVEQGTLTFHYKGKSNKMRKVRMDNNQLANLIRKSSELPGYEIFRYKEGSSYQSVSSQDVNEYLHAIAGDHFTAKDFRTWGGTVLAVELVPEARQIVEENTRKKFSTTLVRLVAKELGNTVSVCREHYIHPTIMELVEEEQLEKLLFENHSSRNYELSAAEQKALSIIQK